MQYECRFSMVKNPRVLSIQDWDIVDLEFHKSVTDQPFVLHVNEDAYEVECLLHIAVFVI